MPNQPRPDNPGRSIRVEDDLWEAAKARAGELEITVTDVVLAALRAFVGVDVSTPDTRGDLSDDVKTPESERKTPS